MNKAIVFAAAALMAAPAFASKARYAALGGAVTTNDDVQEVFNNPAKIFNIGDQFTAEFGAQKEGGFFRSHGDMKYGIYFGNHSSTFDTVVNTINGGGLGTALTGAAKILAEQNPLDIFYGTKAGDLAWALGLHYSSGQNKTATTGTNAVGVAKAESLGLRAGVSTDVWEAYTNIGLSGSTKNDATVDVKNDPTVKVGGEWFMGDSTVYAEVLVGGAKATPLGGTESKISSTTYTLGIESKIKAEGAHFFYGAALMSTETKVDTGNIKQTTMNLPVYAGLEADAASWLVLRGFVKQSLFLDTAKNQSDAGTTLDTTGLTNTSAGFGAGLKFGKIMVDGSLAAQTAGVLGSNDMLANVSLNYWF